RALPHLVGKRARAVPDGEQIGIVAGFRCGEWCDAFVIRRWKTSELASLIYNAAAMHEHDAGVCGRGRAVHQGRLGEPRQRACRIQPRVRPHETSKTWWMPRSSRSKVT